MTTYAYPLADRQPIRLFARWGEGETTIARWFRGREAHTLARLLDAGERGISALDNVGIRIHAYVKNLRDAGLAISMERVEHGGPYKGWHGLYRLGTKVEVVEVEFAK